MMCPSTGWISHATAGAAKAHFRDRMAGGLRVKRIRVYPCRACGDWHLSYRVITAGNRISEPLRRREEDPA
jgi:hypothetical protein